MSAKILTVVFFRCEWAREDWHYDLPTGALDDLLHHLTREMEPFGVILEVVREDVGIKINGYGDLLNTIRLRYPAAGIGNLCLGHVIGSSQNADLLEDLRRGINRVVFAPETVEPDQNDKVVCHNCGCGC